MKRDFSNFIWQENYNHRPFWIFGIMSKSTFVIQIFCQTQSF